ncbi:MAG: sulfatase-like hydrolase/transferase [Verrucomicrobiota bacterium]
MNRIALFATLALALTTAKADQPNILFIMTDDQAPWAIGVWDETQTYADTPHLDAFFKSGAYLKNCFVTTPVCSPSRASLATGRYGSELGITDWINPRKESELGLDPETTTWYETLQQNGYHTGLVGKWHLGLTDAHHPTKTGFDYFMGHRSGGWPTENPTLEKDGEDQKFEGLTTDILTDYAIGFLESQTADQPFLLCLHYRAPHTRWLPVAPEDWAPFEDLDPELPHPDYPGLDVERAKRMTREYLASVRGVDRNVGRILQLLEERGLEENTVVIFTSDHGYNMGHNGIWHKGNGHWVLQKDKMPPATENIPKGQRPNMYDTSLKVPTAIRWPGVTKPGQVVDESFSSVDWFPTICEIAEIDLPNKPLRGTSAASVFKGGGSDWNNDFYGEYSTKHQSQTHMRALRTPHWKLVRDFLNPERDEFFDLKTDPGETTNLIDSKDAEHQTVIAELHTKILDRMKAIGDDTANKER